MFTERTIYAKVTKHSRLMKKKEGKMVRGGGIAQFKLTFNFKKKCTGSTHNTSQETAGRDNNFFIESS